MKDLIVAKYGSESVTNHEGLDSEKIEVYTIDHADLVEDNDIVVVSSGSVALGRLIWQKNRGEDFPKDPQPLALLGSADLVVAWRQAYEKHGMLAGQILTTVHEVGDRSESGTLIRALRHSLDLGIVPIVNENDALSAAELRKLPEGGDNDTLASHIALCLEADSLLLMTSVEGLEDENGRVVGQVGTSAAEHYRASTLVRDHKSRLGRGGMSSKVNAAMNAANRGIDSYIASAEVSIKDVLAGLAGTHFVAKASSGVE